MKTTLLVAVSLLSTAAFASEPCAHDATPVQPGVYQQDYQPSGYQNANYRGYDEGFARSHRGHGQYVLETQQQWVPGATTQVWVAGQCHRVPFSPIQACTPGHYETEQLPGHYENVQQWVWVPRHDEGHRWGRESYGYGRR
jgi:hypothetical protein